MLGKARPAVLIVEDEPFVRMVAADSLGDCGLKTVEAADAGEALDLLEAHPEIELLFTDINMPGKVDGMGLARRAREVRPDVEIIVTSGREQLCDADIPDAGSFLAKPYNPRDLVALVLRKLMGRRRS
jgi:CheY-like chemotaxis protein